MKDNAKLTQAFDTLKEVPERDPAVVQRNRAAFLREAAQLSQQPVSNSLFARLINNYRLTHTRMQFSTLTVGILLAVVMLTFSSGVYAARKSAPSQFLYPVKLWLEDGRLALTNDHHEQTDLRLAYAEERLNEIEGYTGETTDPDLTTALKNFDDLYLILSEEDDLDDVQEQRWENIQEQYNLIHSEDDEEDEADNGSENQSEEMEQSEGQSSKDEHSGQDDEMIAPNNSFDNGEDQSESDTEDTSSEENSSNDSEKDQGSGENAPEETQTPDDGSDDEDEETTNEPDPTPDDEADPKDGSNND